MAAVLLDTHALIWLVTGDERLTPRAVASLTDIETHCSVSAASLWEIAIKISIGKLRLGNDPIDRLATRMREDQIELLPVQAHHCTRLLALPTYHRDPFDRMLIAQALAEDLDLVSSDVHFDAYGVRRLW